MSTTCRHYWAGPAEVLVGRKHETVDRKSGLIVDFILMTKFTIGLQAQLVVQTQQNMFALRISDHNPNREWGNINIQAVIIGLYIRFCATRKLRENISSRVYPVCKTF